jgi:hypothetical protein
MRALGPGSVSSFLKIILDVVFIALSISVGVVVMLAIAALVMVIDPALISKKLSVDIADKGVTAAILAGGLVIAAAYIGAVLVIVERLRRIFATLTAGDPFHPSNVRRLRVIGLMLAAIELARYPIALVGAWIAPQASRGGFGVSPTAWFAVLVVFVLAEVFREGARLRREAELTI